MQSESKPASSEEPEIKKLNPDEAAKRWHKEKNARIFWMFLAIVIACVYGYEKKSKISWLPVTDSPQMCVVMTDWWGLKVQTFYPVWRKPTGETGEYSEQWCIKYPDNTWQVFYNDDGGSSPYNYPPANNKTYF
jgi:hypothetical protein